MIKFEETEVVGWRHAIRGMRNPLNSWDKSDSKFGRMSFDDFNEKVFMDVFTIGPNDGELMKKLRNAGTDHRKFMRMIQVYVDITAPLYWWKEFDTYKVGTVANSCSTMHKIHAKEFTLEDFSIEHLLDPYDAVSPYWVFNQTISILNRYRHLYLVAIKEPNQTDSRGITAKEYWWQMIQLLPSSYNQKRTVLLNYEVLANIYKSRKGHKLDEWKEHEMKQGPESIGNPEQYYFGFCDWIKTLPYSDLITGEFDDMEEEG